MAVSIHHFIILLQKDTNLWNENYTDNEKDQIHVFLVAVFIVPVEHFLS